MKPGERGEARAWGVVGDPKLTWELPEPPRVIRPGVVDPVWLLACWVNERGEQGPWSDPTKWWVTNSLGVGVNTQQRRAA